MIFELQAYSKENFKCKHVKYEHLNQVQPHASNASTSRGGLFVVGMVYADDANRHCISITRRVMGSCVCGVWANTVSEAKTEIVRLQTKDGGKVYKQKWSSWCTWAGLSAQVGISVSR